MSFGFGFGDIATAIKLANDLWKNIPQAPKRYRDIAAEVKNVKNVLEDVHRDFQGHEIPDAQRQKLSEIVGSITQVLKDVGNILDKYPKLKAEQSSFKGRMGRIRDRVLFDDEEIQKLRLRLVSTLGVLGSFVDGLDRKAVSKLATDHTKASLRQDQRRNREILDWLAPTDYADQHSSIRDRCFAGCGTWILESTEYQRWLQGKGEVLFLQGTPGTGKTFLSAVIIESIQKPAGTGLCYYYCDYNRVAGEQLCDILARFLRQLACDNIPLPIESMFEKHYKNGTRPNLQTIREALYLVVKEFKAVWVVVDALDEYLDALQRHRFIQELLDLNRAAKVNVLVTSRPLPEISKNFAHNATLEVRARDDDMSSYITANIGALPNFVNRDPDLQTRITNTIIEVADGIFLLVTLNLQSLQNKRSKGDLEKTLHSLEKGDSGYQYAYGKTMERISSQDRDGLAIDALTWIIYAARPLKILELRHALGTKANTSEFDESFLPDSDDILDACCGLIRIENESEIVRLIHRTAVEYLKGDGVKWLKDGHAKLSDVCNTYLTFKNVKQGPEDLLERYPLYDYANLFWHYHIGCREQPPILQQVVMLQERIGKSSRNVSQQAFAEYLHHSQEWPGITGLHLAALCGLTELIPHFLEFFDVNDKNGFYRTPVSYATEYGRHDTLCVLIERNAHLDFIYESGETLLTHVVRAGFDDILSTLIKSKSPQLNTPNKDGCTPLHLATLQRNVSAVYTLLEAGADPNVVDGLGCTPLLYAVKLEYSEYKTDKWGRAKLQHELTAKGGLSAKGIEDCVSRMERQNNLCAKDYENIIGKLIARNADLTVADCLGRTPIWYAHRQCTVALLAHLHDSFRFKHDVSPMEVTADIFDTREGKATSFLHGNSDLNIVTARIPLDIGVYTDSYKEKTVLHTAAMTDNKMMLEWLIDNHAASNEVRQDTRNFSHQVVLHYHLGTVQYLPRVYWSDQIEVPERIKKETWFNANIHGSLQVLKMLLYHQVSRNLTIEIDTGASQAKSNVDVEIGYTDANSQKHRNIYPMYKEAANQQDWLHAVDGRGQNVLHMSVKKSRIQTVRYLLDNGLDRHVKDKYGRTVLEYACLDFPGTTLVKAILDAKFLQATVAQGNTWSPLHWACRFGDIELLCFLAEAGFKTSVVSTDEPNADWSPLDIAMFCGNTCLVDDLNGCLRADLPWESLIECGLVNRDELNGEIVPVRKNNLIWIDRREEDFSCAICSEV
ncbi:MAG: hypothetical protein GOMPHAMPRED_005659 [Gomphillus americanus]|uniref:Uncharacterized protein n=1 Tax=Gomphillus americanus TaxID=1940652 RepID=A0A8H3IST9_9LECA|nr:MAG: hypothetical protein GOMPHAMPRED_005659 [Gomphillus americanus]